LQTAGTGSKLLYENDRQRVAGGDWVTAWTYIFASQSGSQFYCPSMVHVSSSTFHDFNSVVDPVGMLESGWWGDERNCKKVQSVNIFTSLNVAVCLGHAVQVSVCGCEVSLLCLYLQMHTFERIVSLLEPLCNWCWSQHGDKPLQSAAHTGIGGSNIHYRYVCTLWRPWTYIVFYNSYVVWYSYMVRQVNPGMALWKQNLLTCALASAVAPPAEVHHWSQRPTTGPYCEPV
jgi:hypothetical protein